MVLTDNGFPLFWRNNSNRYKYLARVVNPAVGPTFRQLSRYSSKKYLSSFLFLFITFVMSGDTLAPFLDLTSSMIAGLFAVLLSIAVFFPALFPFFESYL